MNRFSRLLLLSSLTALTACSGDDVRSAIGLERSAPDEFRVVSRPPLSVPPEFSLRPPQPGEDNVAALPADKLTRSMITGTTATYDDANTLPTKADGTPVVDTAVMPVESGAAPSGAESELMSKLGTDRKEADIRTKIVEDHVVKQKEKEEEWFSVDALNPWAKDKETLDAKDEVKKLKDEGKPVIGKHLVLDDEPKPAQKDEKKKEGDLEPQAGEEKKEEANVDASKEEPKPELKAEEPKAEEKKEESKAEVKAETAPKAEEPKLEIKAEEKKEEPKAETPKLDEPKTVLRTEEKSELTKTEDKKEEVKPEEKPNLAKPEEKKEEPKAEEPKTEDKKTQEPAPAESSHTTFKDLKESKEEKGEGDFKIEVPAKSADESLINLDMKDGSGVTTTEPLKSEEEAKAIDAVKATEAAKTEEMKKEEPKKEETAKESEKAEEKPRAEPKAEKPKVEKAKPKAAAPKAKTAPKKSESKDSGPISKPATTSFPSKIIVN